MRRNWPAILSLLVCVTVLVMTGAGAITQNIYLVTGSIALSPLTIYLALLSFRVDDR